MYETLAKGLGLEPAKQELLEQQALLMRSNPKKTKKMTRCSGTKSMAREAGQKERPDFKERTKTCRQTFRPTQQANTSAHTAWQMGSPTSGMVGTWPGTWKSAKTDSHNKDSLTARPEQGEQKTDRH